MNSIKDAFGNLGGFLLVALFLCGYFPMNMILAFINGDKFDVVLSFFIPFYGLALTVFG